MAGKHEDHPDPLFPSCVHDELEERKWIQVWRQNLVTSTQRTKAIYTPNFIFRPE